jgi:hypothetical protein
MGYRRRSFRTLTVLTGALLWPLFAAAQPATTAPAAAAPVAPVTTELRTQFGASINNLGLQQSLEWSRRRLLRPGGGPLTADANVSFGGQVLVSPSYLRFNVWGQYAPLSILTLRVGVEPAQYFGTFDSLMSFDRQADPFDNDSRKARGGAEAGRVLRIYATPTLGLRVGHVLAGVAGDIERWSSSAPGPWFYDPTRDTLLKSDGVGLASTRAIVMYEHVTDAGTRVGVGGIHTRQRVDGRSLNQIQRLGAITTIQSDGRLLGLNRPAMNVVVARYLDDPSKDGGWTAFVTIATTLRRR